MTPTLLLHGMVLFVLPDAFSYFLSMKFARWVSVTLIGLLLISVKPSCLRAPLP